MLRFSRFKVAGVILLTVLGVLFTLPSLMSPETRKAVEQSIPGFIPRWLVPHQANKRIIDATASRMGLSMDKVMINIQRYGNTTSATIPLCLWEWEKQLKKGDLIVLAAFGGGFTWGATLVKWAYDTK